MERAILVTVDFDRRNLDIGSESGELKELAQSSGALVAEEIICKRDKIDPALFIGKGKVEEVRQLCLSKREML